MLAHDVVLEVRPAVALELAFRAEVLLTLASLLHWKRKQYHVNEGKKLAEEKTA